MVMPEAVVMAPPARLMGLLPKNSAGRSQLSRNLSNNDTFPQPPLVSGPPRGWRARRFKSLRRFQSLLQGLEIRGDSLNLRIGQAGNGLHLAFAVFHGAFRSGAR